VSWRTWCIGGLGGLGYLGEKSSRRVDTLGVSALRLLSVTSNALRYICGDEEENGGWIEKLLLWSDMVVYLERVMSSWSIWNLCEQQENLQARVWLFPSFQWERLAVCFFQWHASVIKISFNDSTRVSKSIFYKRFLFGYKYVQFEN